MNKIYPFKFLDSYTKDDKDIFFGRDEETEQLFQMLTQSDIVLVYGASGTGKTSLIQCGLSKKIDDYDWMPFYLRRGTNLNTSIKNSLQKYVPDYKVSVSDFLDELFEDEPTEQAAESEIVELLRKVYMSRFKPLYLIFDQFEELFILGNKQEQNEFLKTIKEILKVELPIKLIFSIREEYLGHLYDFEKEVPELMRKKIRVEAMHREKVQQIIKGVAQYPQSNITIEEDEIETFTLKVFEKIKSKKELSIQLPYLQVFLDKLYLNITNDKKRQQDALFTISELDKLGNIDDVLSEFLEEQVNDIQIKLKQNFPQIEIKHLWEILSKFASLEGTKEPLSKQQLYDRLPEVETKLLDKVIIELTNRSILRYIENEDVYELMHDALAQRVAEKRSEDEIALLQAGQLIKSQSNLKPEARSFFNSKQLALIEPFREKLNLSEEEKDFIEQSEREIEKQRMAEIHRQRKIIAVITIAAIISIAFGVFGFVKMSEAQQNLKKAVNFQVLGKKKDAISFKNQEIFNAAIGKYEELLKIYRQYPNFGFDTTAVHNAINECKQLDSISKIFHNYMNKADSLILEKDIESIKNSFDFYLKADSLNYEFSEKTFEKYNIKLEQAIKNLMEQKQAALETKTQYGKLIATEIDTLLNKIKKYEK